MKKLLTSILMCASLSVAAQETFENPILRGMNPDPSICRVGDDYYIATSSFTWSPGMPVYHSRDLVNWQRICYAMPEGLSLDGLNDNDGIWAVTIRHHNGTFYLIANAQKCGGNFYMTATDPKGPWSKPVWLTNTTGIDPSIFFDDDGKCYYTGNRWDFKHSWQGQCAVWIQELDIDNGKLIGERKDIAYGHAANAAYAEGPHIYKINGKYWLLMAEGGASYDHAVTALTASNVMGPYTPCKVNPVITARHLGHNAGIQDIGHADITDTPDGQWWAVVLGCRMQNALKPIGRETFLCKAEFEDGNLIINPGEGKVLEKMPRPNLREVKMSVSDDWMWLRTRKAPFHTESNGEIQLQLLPEVIDSLHTPAYLFKRVTEFDFTFTSQVKFKAKGDNEEAGIAYYRTANGYFTLMKGKNKIFLTRKDKGKKEIIATADYNKPEVYFKVRVKDCKAQFSYGDTPECQNNIGSPMSIAPLSHNKYNKFNGTGIGIYATAKGKKSKNTASFKIIK